MKPKKCLAEYILTTQQDITHTFFTNTYSKKHIKEVLIPFEVLEPPTIFIIRAKQFLICSVH